MALAQPPWNQNNLKTLFFAKSTLNLSKYTLRTTADTSSPRLISSNGSNSYGGNFDMRDDVRRLCNEGRLKDALNIFHFMDRRGIRPDSSTYASLLQECINKKSLPEGKLIHAHMVDSRFNPEIFLQTKLLIMYAKCGSLLEARHLLDEMPQRNVICWTAMIAGYARHGRNEEALALYYQMQREGIKPDKFTFAGVLPACANLGALKHGKDIHEDITRNGFQSDIFVGSALLDMYAKCGSVKDARHVFDEMPERNVVSWTAMIAGYSQNGYVDEALKLFEKMPERNAVSWTAMVAGYAQNGRVDEALELFQKMPEQNIVSWNAMIAGYAQNGHFTEALKLFQQMQLAGLKPGAVTFTSILPACTNLAALIDGKEVHGKIIRSGFQSYVSVGSALLDMYAKCESIDDARKVFDEMPDQNVVSWTGMIAGYAQSEKVNEALELFQKMPERNAVSWTVMISGFAQNGQVDEALKLFQKMPERDEVSWNAMIAAYVQNGHFNVALKLFQQMQLTSVKPDGVTFTSVLPACANLAALINGKAVHENIIRSGFHSHISVGSALIDMYAKCGTIENARQVFDEMPERDAVSWNAMIGGYAKHGCGKDSFQLFEQMRQSDTQPNHVTFIGVLSACSHAGLVDDGWQYFNSMSRDYHITPAVDHYCCIVDLLGRAGQLDEAHDLINKMPIKPNAAIWGSLLGACRIHINMKLGQRVAECLLELDPKNAACYVMLSNIYAAAGRWDDVEKVRKLMKDRRVKKIPGCSWIEVNNKVYSFVVRDRSHPQTHQIYAELERLSWKMKEAGYAPDTNSVLHDVEEEHKEHTLCHHSEKLAIAFGLLHASPSTPIRIIKNLRMCGDCHSATKFICKIVAREIVVRDANRFHHFKDGQCSCGDYW